MDQQVKLIDGSFGTARELKRRLAEKDLLLNPTDVTTYKPSSTDGNPDPLRNVEILNSSSDTEMVEKSYALLRLREL